MIKTLKKYLTPKDPPDPIPKYWIYFIFVLLGVDLGLWISTLK